VVKIKWHPQEPLLFSCSTDRTIRLWDARTATQVRSWLGHQDMILDFDVSRYLHPVSTPCLVSQRTRETNLQPPHIMTSDGKTVVSASEDSTVLVFSVDN
jgi:WD40 repeat protein